ncbi:MULTISPECIES: hypothetical protein [unclassified Streptomyces]|uniref:hypothetical protein n=1 Tax=unclassified Streptomyces TaxID=2593676 RepID=UPI00403C3AEA
MRVTDCEASAPDTTSRGGGHPALDCKGFVDPAQHSGDGTRRIVAPGFSSDPVFGTPVKVAKQPWGPWVPVDQGDGNRLGRVVSSLIPLALAVSQLIQLALAGLFATAPVAACRRWRNARRSPDGASA